MKIIVMNKTHQLNHYIIFPVIIEKPVENTFGFLFERTRVMLTSESDYRSVISAISLYLGVLHNPQLRISLLRGFLFPRGVSQYFLFILSSVSYTLVTAPGVVAYKA